MSADKALIVVRCSTEEQQPEDQIPACREFCEENDWDIDKVYKETQSAWKTYVPRKKLERALTYAREKDIPHIVFWDIDRFWRNRKKAVETLRAYQKLGIQLHFVRQDFLEDIQKLPEPFDDMVYDILVQLMAWLAEEESKKRSDRVKKAYEQGNHEDWGRPSVPYTEEEILEAYEQAGSMRKASKNLPYRTKSGKKKFVSVGKISEAVKNVRDRSKKQKGKSTEN